MFIASFRRRADPAFREQKSPGGLGSLGRRRFTAVEKSKNGVRDAREAKALVPSARYWWAGQDHMPSQTATLLQHAVRVPDPHFQVHDGWRGEALSGLIPPARLIPRDQIGNLRVHSGAKVVILLTETYHGFKIVPTDGRSRLRFRGVDEKLPTKGRAPRGEQSVARIGCLR